ncbi:hypothetical protein VNO77_15816 [Canavalia gladiata]|uniref:DUF7138 domain-containing protein n=1 Tax=Canavalia gladiata TaxID=3824 RepID=A0AAN9LZV2_CANGL
MFDGGNAPFPVVYYDGNQEINVGTVVVDPTLSFKSLLSILSQRIGISPHQFSVYLAAIGSDRKIPVTAKVNLAAVRHDGASYYLFVKRSKRSKKAPSSGKDSNPSKNNPPENVMLLRRSAAGEETPISSFRAALAAPIFDRVEYERRLRSLQMERESFLMNMATGFNVVAVGREAPSGGDANAVCKECVEAALTGTDCGFHLCVNDKVTAGFRSPAGPICRPARNSGVDCP